MKALITGGAGFIGSHLSELLLKEGWEVAILDDLSTGRKKNLASVLDHPGLTLRQGSVMNQELLKPLSKNADIIFHLAASLGVARIMERRIESIETNIIGTQRALEAAMERGTKVLIASTSEVYGKNDKVPLKEEDDTILGPTSKHRWSYACAKGLDEFLGLAYYHDRKLPVVIVRFFNTVGPRQTGQYGMVIPRFIKQALSDEPITVYGDGEQTRSFTDVDDAVDAVYRVARHEQAPGQVFNVGGGIEISINALARKLRGMTRSKSEITLVPYDQAYPEGYQDTRRRFPDISKITSLTGFRPRRTLEETLFRTIEYHRQNKEALTA